jgi:hypothetical protein
MTGHYGPLVRLWGVRPSQLPGPTATGQELVPLLSSILLEANPFIADVPSAEQTPHDSSWKTKGSRHFPHSKSPVYLYERHVPAEVLQEVAKENHLPGVADGKMVDETWFLRRSVHEDKAIEGTASWDEWVRCFKEGHAQAEKEFTPTVVGTHVEREWDCTGITVDLDGETWGNWTLKLEESTHKMPTPLKPRVFPVLQATTSVLSGAARKFMVVQISAGDAYEAEETKRGQNVRGKYTSIERVRDTGAGECEWIMGTTSDAKGLVPLWVQRMATPSHVAKDVELFLGWIAKKRREGDGTVRNGQQSNGGGHKNGVKGQNGIDGGERHTVTI